MLPIFSVSIAQSTDDLESAFSLLYRNYREIGVIPPNPAELWLTKRHMLPTTANIVVKIHGRVVAAASLFLDSTLGLPLEDSLDLSDIQRSGACSAELSSIAVAFDFILHRDQLCGMLFRFTQVYCTQYLGITHLLSLYSQPALDFKTVTLDAKEIQYMDLSNLDSLEILPRSNDSFIFPDRKFYQMSDVTWTIDKFKFFFIERTSLFDKLNEQDFMALQNIYDFGSFRELFDQRRTQQGGSRNPQFRRFAMNCSADLINSRGESFHLHVLDVSRSGLRAVCEGNLLRGNSYVLRISVGPTVQADIIAKMVWKNPHSKAAGFEVSSSDQAWQNFIAYLESKHSPTDSERVA